MVHGNGRPPLADQLSVTRLYDARAGCQGNPTFTQGPLKPSACSASHGAQNFGIPIHDRAAGAWIAVHDGQGQLDPARSTADYAKALWRASRFGQLVPDGQEAADGFDRCDELGSVALAGYTAGVDGEHVETKRWAIGEQDATRSRMLPRR